MTERDDLAVILEGQLVERGAPASGILRDLITELAFVNVRKGSFDYVERWRAAPRVERD